MVLVVTLMSAPIAVAGAFSENRSECIIAAGCYVITGEITQNDANAIDRAIAEIQRRKLSAPYFILNSNGGDIIAAMQIGRALRRIRAVAIIGEIHTCQSACVLLLAGATVRMVYGTIGIHRPYFTNVNVPTYADAQSAYRRSGEQVKSYLQEMNLSDSLYEAMVRVPSEKMRILTQREITDFGLNQTDPVEQEIYDASAAKTYGVSRQEILRRRNRGDAICPSSPQESAQLAANAALCRQEVMRGIR